MSTSEYLIVGVFIVLIYVLLYYFKEKLFAGFKWKNVLVHLSTLILFLIFFVWGYRNERETTFSGFRFVLVLFIVLYFVYQIYKDIRVLVSKR